MSTDPDQIRQDIEETRNSLSQDVSTLADTVNPAHAVRRTTARAGSAITGAKNKLMGTASQSASGMNTAAGQAMSATQQKMSGAQEQMRRQVSGNPLAVGLIAVGFGWLVGSLLPASSAEEQVAIKVKEAAAPAVTDAARQTAASLKDSAQQAAESVKATAADAAATVKDEAASSAGDVRDQAQAARDTLTDSPQ
jgi:ElaB/YqjD/DUF883 family membrane-anchored ribosome-binding protein